MSSDTARQRKPFLHEPSAVNTFTSSGATKKYLFERQERNYGLFIQIIRSLGIITWFTGCCVSIVVTQIIGLPLYFINRRYFYSYMSMTKRAFGITITALTEWYSPTPVRISGDSSVKGQISLLKDGRVVTKFPERLVLIANHQVYTDWLYLWWVTYTNGLHGYIYIILKESLKYIPVIGQGMMLYGFVFMARKWLADKPRLQHRLEKLKTKRGVSPQGSPIFDPMWLLIFPEGTNLSNNTKRRSDAFCAQQEIAPLMHELLPRSTGLFFCLQQLRGTVDFVYDCTIGYEGPPRGSLPDAYFTLRSTYLRGRPPKAVNFYWRRFAVKDIPLDDQKEFENWLYQRWAEKDRLLDQFVKTGRFPPFEPETAPNGNAHDHDASFRGSGYIESEIKLGHWMEAGKVYGALLSVASILWLIPKIRG